MQLKQLIRDDDAVSPVIGVILMVAITVILAAVIGTFVLGLGDQVQTTAPNAQMSFDYDGGSTLTNPDCNWGSDGTLEISHDGGDSIASTQLNISDGDNTDTWTGCGGSENSDSKVTAGHSAEINVDEDDSVRIVWKSPDGGSSSTVGKWN